MLTHSKNSARFKGENISFPSCALMVFLSFAILAQSAAAQGRGGPGGGSGARPSPDVTAFPSFDMTSVDRGATLFAEQCASCHGANARGGKDKTEVDLMRSATVLMDHKGAELREYLKAGNPARNMPKYDLSQGDATDLATWLHYSVSRSALWGQYTKPNVFSGNPAAGEAFFNGSVGKCNTCHSVTGDLKGVGEKYGHDAPNLQNAILSGGGRGGRGGRGGEGAPEPDAAAADAPRVNPLQAHVDLMLRYSDANIHDLAAYLNDE
jgi:mono/diheme cytochrome c family protein